MVPTPASQAALLPCMAAASYRRNKTNNVATSPRVRAPFRCLALRVLCRGGVREPGTRYHGRGRCSHRQCQRYVDGQYVHVAVWAALQLRFGRAPCAQSGRVPAAMCELHACCCVPCTARPRLNREVLPRVAVGGRCRLAAATVCTTCLHVTPPGVVRS